MPPTSRAVALVLSAVLAAVLLAACGGDDRLSKDEYTKQARTIQDRAERGADGITFRDESPAQVAAGFKRLRTQVERARRDTAALSPPEEVQKAHDRRVEAFAVTSRDLGELIKAVEAKDETRVQQLVSAGLPSQRAQRASQESQRLYRQKGYDALARDP